VPVGTDVWKVGALVGDRVAAGWVGGGVGVVLGGVGAMNGGGGGGDFFINPKPSPRLSSRSTTTRSLLTGRAMAQSATENKQMQKSFIKRSY